MTPTVSVTDSLQVKLLASILFHEAIAHNSPKANEVEEDAGIFTNYIQYFDNVVKRWGSVNDYAAGLPRLRTIFRVIKERNAVLVADNVWSLNHGTLAEFGKPIQERKNYAFYEGYSRLHFDLEKPNYTTGVHTGAGIQMKISDNIELYKANLADTFNMFDTAIINGTTGRRLIVNAKDSLLDKVNTDGLWVKGIMPEDDNDKSDKIWYTGVGAVRLPLRYLRKGNVRVDTAFSIDGAEKMVAGDVGGKVVGGGEKSIIKMSTITTNENYLFDTLSNVSDPGLLMHGESRVIECDTSYYGSGNELMFLMQGPDSIRNRILVEQNDNKVIVHDTSLGSYNGKFKILYNKKVIFVADVNFKATSLGFVEAVNGVAVGIGSSTVPATFKISNTKVLSDAEGAEGNVIVRWTPGLKILNNQGKIIWPDKVDIGYRLY